MANFLELHQQCNRSLYSALLYSIAGGTCATIIKKHEANQDGLAWVTLCRWYEGQGSKNSIGRHAMKNLQSFPWHKDAVGGADSYVGKLEETFSNVEEVGENYSENMKKITFLMAFWMLHLHP